MAVDQAAVEAFAWKVAGDAGAAMASALTLMGHTLGLWQALAEAGPVSAADLAERTGCHERYVREWLSAQAAGGYVRYDPASGTFTLPEEAAYVLAVEESPVFLLGLFQLCQALLKDVPAVTDAFRTGAGVGWGERDSELHEGLGRRSARNFRTYLTSSWIPALDGVEDKLRAGVTVADVGCGHGAATILLAQAFPQSRYFGFDFHEPSIAAARKAAADAGVAQRVSFEVATAKGYPGTGYDLVMMIDALHDMGDPVGAATHVRETLAPDGTLMLVEIRAADRLEDNFTPLGRLAYALSTLACTPVSLAQEVGLALGTIPGEARLREVLESAGFGGVRRVAETVFNIVLEVRP